MLTPRQQQTYQIICEYVEAHQHAPSLEQITARLGLRSRTSAFNYVKALEKSGLIRLVGGRKRNIELIDAAPSDTSLPLVGKIAAGLPIEALENSERIDLSRFFTGPGRFVLKVCGDSMIEAGILDGDMVIIQQQNHARDGQIVVALINSEEATLKYLQKEDDNTISLIPANSSMKPMTYPAEAVQIQGVVVGQMRNYG